MPDLDTELRALAHALVADAPPPPPLPLPVAAPAEPARSPRWVVALAAAAAATVVAVAVVAARPGADPSGQPDVVRMASPPPQCTGPMPYKVTALSGADVEVVWPAPPQPVYGEGPATPLAVGEVLSPDRSVLDIVATPGPDAAVERTPGVNPAPPCDIVQVTVTTAAGRWTAGYGPDGIVDLTPRIVERRQVDAAPATAITCEDRSRPNRVGAAVPEWRGPRPADALLAFLAANPTMPRSGYVEMATPDGHVVYGNDPGARGWTVLVTVGMQGGAWHVSGWQSSGC